ncbi:MAG: class I SAM-dependent methyltransferase [Planctomycetes bacterium]|nr:class I SAM-dependent methyltransferase [Planctomycetota bacterium]
MTSEIPPADDAALAERYRLELAAAFVRGRLGIDEPDPAACFRRGLAAGLKLHKFKRMTLPRVDKVLGVLRGFAPGSLLDLGSGRGAFLWPLLGAFEGLEVTALDLDPRRVADLQALSAGGLTRLTAVQGDLAALPFPDDAFDGVTALEVLEHVDDPARAARELLRVARRFVIASVPSKPDDNPEHLHHFPSAEFSALFEGAGATRVGLDAVLNHWIAVVRP